MSGAPFWVVWSPQGDSPTFKHGTLEGAELEAKRLAGLHQGQEFIVLGSVAMFRATRVERVSLLPKPAFLSPRTPLFNSVGGTPRE